VGVVVVSEVMCGFLLEGLEESYYSKVPLDLCSSFTTFPVAAACTSSRLLIVVLGLSTHLTRCRELPGVRLHVRIEL
jgi:hypothetical protein